MKIRSITFAVSAVALATAMTTSAQVIIRGTESSDKSTTTSTVTISTSDRDKDLKKKQKTTTLKELRFHPNTDKHDFDFKSAHLEEFLRKGNRVRATIVFLGRSIIYKDKGLELAERLTERLSIVSNRDGDPKFEGKKLFVYFEPDKKKIDAYERIKARTSAPLSTEPIKPAKPAEQVEPAE